MRRLGGNKGEWKLSTGEAQIQSAMPGNERAAGELPALRPVLAGDRLAMRMPTDALEPVAAPPPPRRSRMARNRLVVALNALFGLLVFSTVAVCGGLYFGKLRFIEGGPLAETRTILIKEGSSLQRIAEQLAAAGVVDSELIFRAGVRAYGSAGEMKPGEYAFAPAMSMYEVMDAIRSGKGVIHKITLAEGLTVRQIFDKLAANDVLEGPLPSVLPPEGSLLPETYPFQRGSARQEVVQRMQKARAQLLESVWTKRIAGLPLKSPEELATLASIVEKETGKPDERPRVAAVFINRLKKGMRLQSDPTIIYGLFGSAGKPEDRPILRSDLDKPTPYNTYLIDGLPPGPIANPGRAALEAVANPSRTDDLFFVADGTGGHVFAVTLGEHEENVRRWRVVEKRLKEEADKKAARINAPDDSVRVGNGEEQKAADPVSQ